MKKISITLLFILIAATVLFSISKNTMNQNTNQKKIRYVALGDSYTICEGASWEQSWPYILTQHLNEHGIAVELIANPSVTGFTTQDLIDKELSVYDASNPDFATLLIGVNDWVQKVDAAQFHKNLIFILDKMQAKLAVKTNLVLVTIPDFGITPKGAHYSGGRNISQGIADFNSIILQEAKKRNLKTVDIFPTTQQMKNNPDLISGDDLHPSAKEYAIWETLIYPTVYDVLKNK